MLREELTVISLGLAAGLAIATAMMPRSVRPFSSIRVDPLALVAVILGGRTGSSPASGAASTSRDPGCTACRLRASCYRQAGVDTPHSLLIWETSPRRYLHEGRRVKPSN